MIDSTTPHIPADIRHKITTLLGREARGLEDVALFSPSGQPMVIRVASMVDGAPFPNLFWLIDPELVYRIDVEEAGGLIQRLQHQVDSGVHLRDSLISDHNAHIALRNRYMSEPMKANLRAANYYEVLQRRGIGGIADFGRIRCLHTWYAAHLIVPNTIGTLLDNYWAEASCDTTASGNSPA